MSELWAPKNRQTVAVVFLGIYLNFWDAAVAAGAQEKPPNSHSDNGNRVKNSKAASLNFTLTTVSARNGKFFDPCWKKARQGVKGGVFYHVGWTFLLQHSVIKLQSWRGVEMCCDLLLIILNSLEMRLGDFCH